MSTDDGDWPPFEDRFLASVMDELRERSRDLWVRGRLLIDGENGPGEAEFLVVTLDVRPRRSIVLQCEPGGYAALVIRGTGRSDNGRPLFASPRTRVDVPSADLVRTYDDVLSAVLRSPSDFADEVGALWRRVSRR